MSLKSVGKLILELILLKTVRKQILTKFFFKFQEDWHPLLSEETKTILSSDFCCAYCAWFEHTTRFPSVIQHNFSQVLWEFRSLFYYIPTKLCWEVCKHWLCLERHLSCVDGTCPEKKVSYFSGKTINRRRLICSVTVKNASITGLNNNF